ncbi:hypothetical protein DL98DRAFT_607374 [Cadophora sp. DSE1049]|nr:hypothetical protein DL98DRAFT_607374 [Cadophora sp. DSE1049]
MADPPQLPHSPPSPQTPLQESADEEIKNEHDGRDIGSVSEADQQQSASEELDFEELLNRIAMQNQIFADMQKSQLQQPAQNGFANPAGLQEVPGPGQFIPPAWVQPGLMRPFHPQQMFLNSPRQFHSFNPGHVSHHGFPNQPEYAFRGGRALQMQNGMPAMMPRYVQQMMPSIGGSYTAVRGRGGTQGAAPSRGNHSVLRGRGDIQREEESHRGNHSGQRGRGAMQNVAPSRGNQSTLRERGDYQVAESDSSCNHPGQRKQVRAGVQKAGPSFRGPHPRERGRGRSYNQTPTDKLWQPNPSGLCCQCGSHVHQLKHHPNPNTSQGYLRGCFHCNNLSHSLSKRPYRHDLKSLKWYYLRICRTGLCPAEDFRDFREIPRLDGDDKAQYNVEMNLPLTPQFALEHLYPDEKHFQHPLEGGDIVLFEDLSWESGDPLADLGCFGVEDAPADNREHERWIHYTSRRRSELQKQVEERGRACLLDLTPVQTVLGFCGTKKERSSTPPSHQTSSSQHQPQPSAHKNLPVGPPPGNQLKSSPESPIAYRPKGFPIPRRQQKQEPSEDRHTKRTRQRSASPNSSESSFSDLSTKAVSYL